MATLTAGFIWAPEDAPVTRIPTKKKSFIFGKIFLVIDVEPSYFYEGSQSPWKYELENHSPSLRSLMKMRLLEELRLKQDRPFVCICHHHCNPI